LKKSLPAHGQNRQASGAAKQCKPRGGRHSNGRGRRITVTSAAYDTEPLSAPGLVGNAN